MSHAEQVRELIRGGARFIQIREKAAASNELYSSVVESIEAASESGAKIIVNDRVDIAMVTGADGVHLGQTDLPPAEARKLLGDEAVIGISTHNPEQVKDALVMPVDYIAFGPIWPTSTKVNPDPAVGLGTLSEVKKLVGDIPLVAIGGITQGNLAATLAAGADSLAIIGDLYGHGVSISVRYEALITDASVKHL